MRVAFQIRPALVEGVLLDLMDLQAALEQPGRSLVSQVMPVQIRDLQDVTGPRVRGSAILQG